MSGPIMKSSHLYVIVAISLLVVVARANAEPPASRPAAITMAELAKLPARGVAVHEVSDYVFGGYRGGVWARRRMRMGILGGR